MRKWTVEQSSKKPDEVVSLKSGKVLVRKNIRFDSEKKVYICESCFMSQEEYENYSTINDIVRQTVAQTINAIASGTQTIPLSL